MKKIILILGILVILISCSVNQVDTQKDSTENGGVQPAYTYNTLKWSNEGTTSGWSYDIGNGSWGWGNGELEYYRSQNATATGGILTITAKKESYGGFAYTSARIKGPSYAYSRVEARIQCPSGQGLWSAFWMLGSGTWPKGGENDIMETVNSANTVTASTHWYDEANAWNASYSASKSVVMTSYHIYTMEKDANYIRTYCDGTKYYEILITKSSAPSLTELHNSMTIILNLAVGGTWPGSPNSSTTFPAKMNIDYVRVYQ